MLPEQQQLRNSIRETKLA